MLPTLEVCVPKNFGMREVILANLYCLLPYGVICSVVIGLSIVAVILISTLADSLTGIVVLGFTLLAIYTTGLALVVYFFPIFQANPYIRVLVERRLGKKRADSVTYVCQCSLFPRLHRGLRGFLEDGDDMGRLEITGDGIAFAGDHVSFNLPFAMIDRFTHVNSGYRMLWIAGRRIQLFTRAFEGIESIEFMERESNMIPTSRRLSSEMIYAIGYGLQLERADNEVAST